MHTLIRSTPSIASQRGVAYTHAYSRSSARRWSVYRCVEPSAPRHRHVICPGRSRLSTERSPSNEAYVSDPPGRAYCAGPFQKHGNINPIAGRRSAMLPRHAPHRRHEKARPNDPGEVRPAPVSCPAQYRGHRRQDHHGKPDGHDFYRAVDCLSRRAARWVGGKA